MKALRVVKVGGSLLDYDGLASRLRQWLAQQPPLATVLIAGGGPFADVIRAADAQHQLGEETSHRLCIDALSLTARLLASLLPEAKLVRDFAGIVGDSSGSSQQLWILDPASIFVAEQSGECPLPHTWNVTSDSIAARVAANLKADELVLLKSASGRIHSTRACAADGGYVDCHFPIAAKGIGRVRWVDLRRADFEEGLLLS